MHFTRRVLGDTRTSFPLLLVFATLAFIYDIRPTILVVVLYAAFIAIVSMFNPLYGAIGVVVSLSMVGLKIETWAFGLEIFSLFSFLVAVGLHWLVYSALGFKPKVYLHRAVFPWYGGLAFLVGLTGMLNSIISSEVGSFRTSLHVIALLLFGAIIASLIARSVNGYRLLSQALIVAFVVAVAILIKDKNLIQLGTRLTLHGSVRTLANLASTALVLSACSFFNRQPWPDVAGLVSTRLRVFVRLTPVLVLILAVIILAGTVSRGAILASGIAMAILMVTRPFDLQTLRHRLTQTLLLGLLFAGGVIASLHLDSKLGGGILRMRVAAAIRQGVENARVAIWGAALENMDLLHWWIGAGAGEFRTLAGAGGWDFYAHSIFLDTLVSTGLLGLFSLISLLVFILAKATVTRNYTGLTLTLFLVANFLTHGDMQSLLFWILLGLVHGISVGSQLSGRTFRTVRNYSEGHMTRCERQRIRLSEEFSKT